LLTPAWTTTNSAQLLFNTDRGCKYSSYALPQEVPAWAAVDETAAKAVGHISSLGDSGESAVSIP
ncbi:hypothetical protein, partial [Mycobacterium avium]|uniref:hypothetical protein n=1 Tax=Mycobacterium avium TaxID=1764 RepID=UPI001CC7C651